MKSHRLLALLIALVLSIVTLVRPTRLAAAAGIRYATPTGTGDCSSWANACTLQTALLGASAGDQIWVVQGTHTPGASRTATFQLRNGVALYGGFAGGEEFLDDRNFTTNETVLSGEIGITDNNHDNSYHVVTGSNTDATAVLDGFTITGGNANGASGASDDGGGMYTNNGSPTLTNVTFSGNSAGSYGGGMYNNASDPTLTYVTFSENSSSFDGGGMYNNASDPTLTNVTFSENWANYSGGGMGNFGSSPILMDTSFIDNSTGSSAGGMFNDQSSPILSNVTFSGNSADYGGGMYNGGIGGGSSPMLIHVTFSNNRATEDKGGGMYNFSGNPTLSNTILWGNLASTTADAQIFNFSSVPAILHSVVQGGCPGGSICANLITTDPKLGVLGDWGGATLTIPLLPGSSAIDTADADFCPETDQRGVTRPQGFGCDIGAFEVMITLKHSYLPLVIR